MPPKYSVVESVSWLAHPDWIGRAIHDEGMSEMDAIRMISLAPTQYVNGVTWYMWSTYSIGGHSYVRWPGIPGPIVVSSSDEEEPEDPEDPAVASADGWWR